MLCLTIGMEKLKKSNPGLPPAVTRLSLGRVCRRFLSPSAQVTLVKDNIMPRLIILSGVNDEGVRVDVSRAYASISSNAQCQVSPNKQTPATLEHVFDSNERCLRVPDKTPGNPATLPDSACYVITIPMH